MKLSLLNPLAMTCTVMFGEARVVSAASEPQPVIPVLSWARAKQRQSMGPSTRTSVRYRLLERQSCSSSSAQAARSASLSTGLRGRLPHAMGGASHSSPMLLLCCWGGGVAVLLCGAGDPLPSYAQPAMPLQTSWAERLRRFWGVDGKAESCEGPMRNRQQQLAPRVVGPKRPDRLHNSNKVYDDWFAWPLDLVLIAPSHFFLGERVKTLKPGPWDSFRSALHINALYKG